MKKVAASLFLSFVALFFVSHVISAHEVYVLSHDQVIQAIDTPSFNELSVADQNLGEFTFWAFVSVLLVVVVFFSSISGWAEKKFDPFFARIKKHAPLISRLTVGFSFLFAALNQGTYGPELPLTPAYGAFVPLITVVLVAIGLCIIFNFYARVAAAVSLVLFGYAVYRNGWYMLTYVNYLGEFFILLSGIHSLSKKLAPYGFLVLRVLFGISLIFASAYAKIIHNNLALFTVEKFHLDKILGFEPHFLVLGAAIVELVIGTFFILGIEIRFVSAFFLFWLTLSLIFFGEAVWPHIILIGLPIAFICYGYDKYSVEGRFFKKGKREPVL